MEVQEGERPNSLDPKNPVYAEETSPSVIVNGFSERLQASHIQKNQPHSENLVGSHARSVTVHLALILALLPIMDDMLLTAMAYDRTIVHSRGPEFGKARAWVGCGYPLEEEIEEIDSKRIFMKIIEELKQEVKICRKEMEDKYNKKIEEMSKEMEEKYTKKFEEMSKSVNEILGNQEKTIKQVIETVQDLKTEMESMKKSQTEGWLAMENLDCGALFLKCGGPQPHSPLQDGAGIRPHRVVNKIMRMCLVTFHCCVPAYSRGIIWVDGQRTNPRLLAEGAESALRRTVGSCFSDYWLRQRKLLPQHLPLLFNNKRLPLCLFTMSCEPFICCNRPPDSPGRMALQGLMAILAGLREPPGTSHHHILFKRTKFGAADSTDSPAKGRSRLHISSGTLSSNFRD
ncbi:hypothetical protein U0070_001316 [Myodes glareolus]|uniref:Uncharacterized protein n=1 Tax=Myodes glareolus TaxID=447135 RepID=A0AAW0HZJ5_MYOGA